MRHINQTPTIMLTGLTHLHSFLPYFIFLLLILSLVRSIPGWLNKKSYTDGDKKIGLFALIFSHIQFLVGLGVYIMEGRVHGFSSMGEATPRFYALEHPLMMIIAITLITIGHSKSKKLTDPTAQHKTKTIFFGLALLIALSRVPWSAWLNLA